MGLFDKIFRRKTHNVKKSPVNNKEMFLDTKTVSCKEMIKILKEFRVTISKKQKMIPYMVFNNDTLKEIIQKYPTSEGQFYKVKGLGKKRFEMYGKELLEITNEYVISDDKDFSCFNKKLKEISKNENNPLYDKIRLARNQKAKELGIKPFQIFGNKTIEDLVVKRPTQEDELYDIHGLGNIKVQQYGSWLIEVLKGKTKPVINTIISIPELVQDDYRNIENMYQRLDKHFTDIYYSNHYVSRKEITNIRELYLNEISLITQLNDDESFKKVAMDNGLETQQMKFLQHRLMDLENSVRERNKSYIEYKLLIEEEYLDNILQDVDPVIKLDLNQRISVLNDEDYALILAGAGAGKTTTVAAKVKYLVDKKHIDPNQILVVSFTNKAVDELKERINRQLRIPSEICTFHKVGLNIVKNHHSFEKLNIVHDGLMFNLVRDYLTKKVIENPTELKDLILFFGYYIDMPTPDFELDKFFIYQQSQDFTSMKEEIKQINEDIMNRNQKVKKTIKNEIMRSIEEVQIANFLYLNGIEYEYESAYPYHIKGTDKLYTPDFTLKVDKRTIYLEHFGIHENGSHNRYSEDKLNKYQSIIKDKLELHKKHGTELITTYSKYNDCKTLIEHLKEELEKFKIPINEKPASEVFQEIVKEENNKYFNKFIMLINNFISNFKTNGFSEDDFDRLYNRVENVRAKLFLKLCKPIYLYYQAFLAENEYTDFEDMINNSTKIVQQSKKEDFKDMYKYIIVDEYQDISRQRFNLTKELATKTDAKIIAVGDDWQSIYAFAGSQITLFTKFKEEMGYADYLTIDYTYRNAQEVIDAAGAFVQKNTTQLKKQLKSPKHIEKPFVFYEYNDYDLKDKKKGKKGVVIEKAEKLDEVIGKIVKVEGKSAEILLLVRYNFEIKQIVQNSDLFFETSRGVFKSANYPNTRLTILTVHKSKGLGFDNVILLNGSDEYFGFPSQIEIDPLLTMVVYDDKSYKYAEERRLFYVALTRTKNRVFILYPASKPSAFIREMVEDYEDVTLRGTIVDKESNRKVTKCPVCGYPLQYKNNKTYGLKLYMCTNEVELCGFMSNNLRGGKASIQKCDQCKDGFLIIKPKYKEDTVFLGCTNYKSNGKGCNNSKSIE
jgi:DNA helicase-4